MIYNDLIDSSIWAQCCQVRTCAFMMRSMLADQPYSPVTRTHGESTIRSLTTTFSICGQTHRVSGLDIWHSSLSMMCARQVLERHRLQMPQLNTYEHRAHLIPEDVLD